MALLVAFYWRSSKNSPLQNKSLISASNKKHQLCNTLNTWLIMLVHAINWFCSRYTVIHGQCLTVGVGGYLLGGGVNALGSSARHGFAAKNIIQMKVKWIGFHNKQYFFLYFTYTKMSNLFILPRFKPKIYKFLFFGKALNYKMSCWLCCWWINQFWIF